jgi:hypothetical protein
LCTFGMEDPVRNGLKADGRRRQCGRDTAELDVGSNKTEVTVRILTGDHPETARHVAIEAGIISDQ